MGFEEYHKKAFWIFWISFNIELGGVVILKINKRFWNYTVPNVLKIRVLPFRVSVLVFHALGTFCTFLTVLKKFLPVLVSLWYEKYIPSILIASSVKSTVFKPQTASRIPLSGPKPAILYYLVLIQKNKKILQNFQLTF